MVARYIPAQGDIVLLQFNPQSGREQAGHRPAVVLSSRAYNEKVGLFIACPVTSQSKGYPFEVLLPQSLRTCGVILADHVKSLDWKVRNATFVERLPGKELSDALQKIALLLQLVDEKSLSR